MPLDDNSNKSLLKGFSVFGGVQFFQILINLIRGKFVAMFLGKSGMGVSQLFVSTINPLQLVTSFGINLAIVKEVSSSRTNDNDHLVALLVIKRLILACSLFGAVVCFALSPLLSRWTFGNDKYTYSFMALSAMVFFTTGSNGNLSILQGAQELKRISTTSIVGGLVGLFVCVPLYYFLGEKGIVPSMIMLSFATYIFYRLGVKKSCKSTASLKFIWREHKDKVYKIITLSSMLMVGTLVGFLVAYLINVYIRMTSSTDEVGLYNAANSITNQYVGLVFSAMASDYFPRLTKIISNNEDISRLANRQTRLILFIITPLVITLILSAPLLIELLLTKEFYEIKDVIRWFGYGIIFRALCFPLGYITLAKENKKIYFFTEVVLSNVINLFFSCALFSAFGLLGLGFTVAITGILGTLADLLVNVKLYGFKYERQTMLIIAANLILSTSAIAISLYSGLLSYVGLSAILLISLSYSYINIKRSINAD